MKQVVRDSRGVPSTGLVRVRFIPAVVLTVLLSLLLLHGAARPASADSCDQSPIISAWSWYSYTTPTFCEGETVIPPLFPGAPYGYTSPGNTPYVNGQPQLGPFSNISVYTPSQAAAARAAGDATATSNAYSQYGGFAPPGDTATHEKSPSYDNTGY